MLGNGGCRLPPASSSPQLHEFLNILRPVSRSVAGWKPLSRSMLPMIGTTHVSCWQKRPMEDYRKIKEVHEISVSPVVVVVVVVVVGSEIRSLQSVRTFLPDSILTITHPRGNAALQIEERTVFSRREASGIVRWIARCLTRWAEVRRA